MFNYAIASSVIQALTRIVIILACQAVSDEKHDCVWMGDWTKVRGSSWSEDKMFVNLQFGAENKNGGGEEQRGEGSSARCPFFLDFVTYTPLKTPQYEQRHWQQLRLQLQGRMRLH